MPDCASRAGNFYSDIYRYGKPGERFAAERLAWCYEQMGYQLFDVTTIPIFQQNDVDFVAIQKGMVYSSYEEILYNDAYIKIEVKVDTRCQTTENFLYEYISHGKPGWCLKTHAQYVIIVDCDDVKEGVNTNGMLMANRWYLLDMRLWRDYAIKNAPYAKKNNLGNENVWDYKHRIDSLRESGVILYEEEIGRYI